jgi:signal transduction histidine kinase
MKLKSFFIFIFILILFSQILALGISYSILSVKYYKQRVELIEKDFDRIHELHRVNLAHNIYMGDQSVLNYFIENMASSNSVGILLQLKGDLVNKSYLHGKDQLFVNQKYELEYAGKKYGTIAYQRQIQPYYKIIVNEYLYLFLLNLLIMALLMLIIYQFTSSKILKPFKGHLSNVFNDTQGEIRRKNRFFPSELLELMKLLKTYFLKSQENTKAIAIVNTARQVAHDIRSPLSALDTAINLSQDKLSEDVRVIMRLSLERIEDIANDLSAKKVKHVSAEGGDERSVQLLSCLIASMVTEKRMQYRSSLGIKIAAKYSEESYGVFANIQPKEFKRVLSNVVNNAIEAIGKSGEVNISLRQVASTNHNESDWIEIFINDNGRGIASDYQNKIMQKGVTIGKESGSGLGLYHAKQTIEEWGGNIVLESELNKGTTVTIRLPKHAAPNWFLPMLSIKEGAQVAILDDDDSIHHVWQQRLFDSGIRKNQIHHFSTAEDLSSWYATQEAELQDCTLYLCDYELLGSKQSGLDVIKKLNLGGRAILVTSHFEEKDLQVECQQIGVKLLPKNLAGVVPILVKPRLKVA